MAALLWTLVQGRAGLKKARKANIIARDTARRQLRAYLAIDIVGFSGLPKSEKPTYSCVLRNCGQTPARNVKGEIHAYFDDWDHAPQLPDINSVLSRPGQTLGPDRTLGAFRRSLTLSPADKARWLKNEITLYLVVRHVYEDVFGKRHRLDQMYKARPRDGGDAMDAICDAERQMDENDSLDQPPSADEAAL
ncbi:hypothetical protein J2W22_001264 [Sphingomonas kyeonggiensis]|uniref:hypothetical protein n=1 Tax=Sphingomonas kyeonggiensis TaxID=1268553 RepID=UPI002785E09C|nr:hypothetical protein [Sphingomonas kyeonggiensis]MDQ0249217.1 hypothetical protein [Sphingomonas kyeonggiensis]